MAIHNLLCFLKRPWTLLIVLNALLLNGTFVMAKDIVVIFKDTRSIQGEFIGLNQESLYLKNISEIQRIPKNEIEIIYERLTRNVMYQNPAPDKKLTFQESQALLDQYARFPDRYSDLTFQPFGLFMGGIGVVEFQTRLTDKNTIAPRFFGVSPGSTAFTGLGGGVRYRYYPLGHISPTGIFAGITAEYFAAWANGKPAQCYTAGFDTVDSFKGYAGGLEIGYRFVTGHTEFLSLSWAITVSVDFLCHFDQQIYGDQTREVTYGRISPNVGFGIAF